MRTKTGVRTVVMRLRWSCVLSSMSPRLMLLQLRLTVLAQQGIVCTSPEQSVGLRLQEEQDDDDQKRRGETDRDASIGDLHILLNVVGEVVELAVRDPLVAVGAA